MRLDFFVKLRDELSTIILSIGRPNKYSVRDLLCDVNNICATYGNDVSAPMTSATALASCEFHS